MKGSKSFGFLTFVILIRCYNVFSENFEAKFEIVNKGRTGTSNQANWKFFVSKHINSKLHFCFANDWKSKLRGKYETYLGRVQCCIYKTNKIKINGYHILTDGKYFFILERNSFIILWNSLQKREGLTSGSRASIKSTKRFYQYISMMLNTCVFRKNKRFYQVNFLLYSKD